MTYWLTLFGFTLGLLAIGEICHQIQLWSLRRDYPALMAKSLRRK